MNKIKEIILKEWAEVFKNKFVFFTMSFMPLLFAIIPLFILYTILKSGDPGLAMNGEPETLSAFCGNVSELECSQLVVVSQFIILFLIIPVMIPVLISAYSIVGEKTTGTLEPLLASPVTTIEIVFGKAFAAAAPALIATWVSFSIFAVGSYIITKSNILLNVFTNYSNLSLIFILSPLLSIAGISTAMMVSSRSNDPRVAEQLSAFVIIPIIALFIGQTSGYVQINQHLVVWLILVVLLIDIVLIYFATKLFERETILTRWK